MGKGGKRGDDWGKRRNEGGGRQNSKGRGGEVATSWGRRLGRKEIGTPCRKEKQVKMRNSNQKNSTKY